MLTSRKVFDDAEREERHISHVLSHSHHRLVPGFTECSQPPYGIGTVIPILTLILSEETKAQ